MRLNAECLFQRLHVSVVKPVVVEYELLVLNFRQYRQRHLCKVARSLDKADFSCGLKLVNRGVEVVNAGETVELEVFYELIRYSFYHPLPTLQVRLV